MSTIDRSGDGFAANDHSQLAARFAEGARKAAADASTRTAPTAAQARQNELAALEQALAPTLADAVSPAAQAAHHNEALTALEAAVTPQTFGPEPATEAIAEPVQRQAPRTASSPLERKLADARAARDAAEQALDEASLTNAEDDNPESRARLERASAALAEAKAQVELAERAIRAGKIRDSREAKSAAIKEFDRRVSHFDKHTRDFLASAKSADRALENFSTAWELMMKSRKQMLLASPVDLLGYEASFWTKMKAGDWKGLLDLHLAKLGILKLPMFANLADIRTFEAEAKEINAAIKTKLMEPAREKLL